MERLYYKGEQQKCSQNVFCYVLTFSHIQQTCSRSRLRNIYSKMWKISLIVGIIIEKSWKHCGKMRNYSFWTIYHLATRVSKVVCCRCVKLRLQVGKGFYLTHQMHAITMFDFNVLIFFIKCLKAFWISCVAFSDDLYSFN